MTWQLGLILAPIAAIALLAVGWLVAWAVVRLIP